METRNATITVLPDGALKVAIGVNAPESTRNTEKVRQLLKKYGASDEDIALVGLCLTKHGKAEITLDRSDFVR